ncbi:MAG: HAD family hydrolase [Phycisphaerales bacterium]
MPGTLPIRQHDLVICDIDGCLTPESSTPFDLDNLALIAAHNRLAQERGDRPTVTVCSGRPQPFAEAICRLIHNTTQPCVCENGAWVYHPGTNLYTLDPAISDTHLHAVHELSEWAHRTFASRGVTEQPGKTASVTLWHPDTSLLRDLVLPAVAAEVKRRGGAGGSWPFNVSMTWLYINCDLAHINKGTALDRMLPTLKIPKARLAGIGDTLGDKFIADRAGWFACPANAAPQIKEHAHYVSPHAEAAGVVDILSHLVSA